MKDALKFPLIVLFSLTLLACSTPNFGSDDPGLTADQRAIRHAAEQAEAVARENRGGTILQGAALGAAGGAVLGCVFEELMGRDCARGAAFGAAGGAATGAVAGVAVANANERAAADQASLDAMIAASRQKVATNQQAVVAARRIADQHRSTLASLNRQVGAAQASQAQIDAELDEVEADQEALDALSNDLSESIDSINEQIAAGGSPRQIEQLRQERDSLQIQQREINQASLELADILSRNRSAG